MNGNELDMKKLNRLTNKCEKIIKLRPCHIDMINDEKIHQCAIEVLRKTHNHLTKILKSFDEPGTMNVIYKVIK